MLPVEGQPGVRWSVSRGLRKRARTALAHRLPWAWQACAGPRVAVRFILPQFQCPGYRILDALLHSRKSC